MKKLLAIAIAATLAAPAMADTTLYGQLNASVDVLDADGGVDRRTSVSSNSSRVGIKGSVDLNNGLKGIYKAEWGMDTGGSDNDQITKSGNTAITNRNQVVGVAGGFGAVLIGRHDTPLKIIGRKADLFWSTQLGQNRSAVNAGAWDLRPNNVIAYQSPKMGGFQALAAYVTDLGDTDTTAIAAATAAATAAAGATPASIAAATAAATDAANFKNSAFSINGIYNAGPLMVGVGYEKHDVAIAGATSDTRDATRLVASYKFSGAKVVGFYQKESDVGFTSGTDADTFGIGASYKVSPVGTIKGQYYTRDLDGATNTTDLLALGYDHKLGKSTEVYAQYATISGDGVTLGGSGHGESISSGKAVDGQADGFSVGLRHKF